MGRFNSLEYRMLDIHVSCKSLLTLLPHVNEEVNVYGKSFLSKIALTTDVLEKDRTLPSIASIKEDYEKFKINLRCEEGYSDFHNPISALDSLADKLMGMVEKMERKEEFALGYLSGINILANFTIDLLFEGKFNNRLNRGY